MTKRVQIARGPYDVESNLVGLEGEVRADTSNDSLRLHDGVKVGGFEFLNRDATDVIYQARSTELDGFNFGAQEKGIVVRVGPATYRIRRVEVNEDQLVITNPRGTAGNFIIEWATAIQSDHTFNGLITFSQPIAADGGVVGNVVGNLLGNVVGNLTGNAAGNHTGTFTGDVIIPDGSTVSGADDSIAENMIHQLLVNRGVPYGAILMWSGIIADIPESWALCDGTNGTPDLRNRFIVGAGDDYSELEVGGSETLTGTGVVEMGGAHTHTLTIAGHVLTTLEMPEHNHGNGVADSGGLFFNHGTMVANPTTEQQPQNSGFGGVLEGFTTSDGGDAAHTHTGSTADSGGAHTHDITLDEVASLPPYFALCYIMKIAAD